MLEKLVIRYCGLPLYLWTSSTPSTTRIRESADVISTSEELPGSNCFIKPISQLNYISMCNSMLNDKTGDEK